MYLILKTAPAVELATVAEIKSHLRISHTSDDTYLAALATAVTALIDGPSGILRRATLTQTWYAKLEDWPEGDCIKVPLPPLQSVTAITYYDMDNALQTLPTDDYVVVLPYGAAGYVELLFGEYWPPAYDRPDAISVEFVAGYGGAVAVPMPIKHAALLLASEMYAVRGDDPGELPFAGQARAATHAAIDALLSKYIWREIA